MEFFKKLWNCSRIRFYILNTIHNYKFWLLSKKIYTTKSYIIPDNDFSVDYDWKIVQKKKKVETKRFVGYLYNNKIYLDNPGLENIERETWKAWRRKGLID